ncbi:uncharacterized protein LOC129000666 [Macrosteles quadrilineatus]|uniref:uncharacterized protein LOC129000666 n=1 Tax=Macrosteles quadrilineatus TaxID=74068 RepID=UPI0023E20AB5|nr:uncharacterized protein LOC129000666 [Macrosteles quadrilineatus]
MELVLTQFCYTTPLRSGCKVIGGFLIISATLYLGRHFTQQQLYEPDEGVAHFLELVSAISLAGSVCSYIIAIILLVGVYKDVLQMLLGSSVLLFLYAVSLLGVSGYMLYIDQAVYFITLTIYELVNLYFAIVVFSYYLERKEETQFLTTLDEPMRSALERQRDQAKEQGVPDPMRAALMKYRTDIKEEKRKESQLNQAGSSQPTPGN